MIDPEVKQKRATQKIAMAEYNEKHGVTGHH